MPVLRDVSNGLIDNAFGTWSPGGGFELSPVVSAGESLLSAAEAAIKIPFSEDDEMDLKNLEKIVKAGSLAMGAPKYFDDVLFNFLDWLGDAGELQANCSGKIL